jgi:hypothetical protein
MDRIIDTPSKPTTTKKYSSPSPLSVGSTSSSESEIVLPTRKKPVQKVNLFSDSEDDDEIEVVAVKKPDKKKIAVPDNWEDAVSSDHKSTNNSTTFHSAKPKPTQATPNHRNPPATANPSDESASSCLELGELLPKFLTRQAKPTPLSQSLPPPLTPVMNLQALNRE